MLNKSKPLCYKQKIKIVLIKNTFKNNRNCMELFVNESWFISKHWVKSVWDNYGVRDDCVHLQNKMKQHWHRCITVICTARIFIHRQKYWFKCTIRWWCKWPFGIDFRSPLSLSVCASVCGVIDSMYSAFRNCVLFLLTPLRTPPPQCHTNVMNHINVGSFLFIFIFRLQMVCSHTR